LHPSSSGEIQTIAFLYFAHHFLKGQHHEKYFDYYKEPLAYHLGLWAPQMNVLFVQLNIYQLFFLLRCKILSQLNQSSLHTGVQNGDSRGSKSPHMFKKMCGQLEAFRPIAAGTPTPPWPCFRGSESLGMASIPSQYNGHFHIVYA
jgi:hypothetical protein